ncbi:hypothetical protein HU200_041830 [Digitaria exilis]|uniref:Uncharacterized protein n=1 Tax=Digitaria exilis TaxID=1010633 RepID=A0A835EIW2_9POAL|nr:hypothetical protein HU200_041830 [Digitaria exilis]
MKAKKNEKMDPLLFTEATHAQGWLVEGGDEEDDEPVCGLTWKLIEEACGVEEYGNLRRSARLAQMSDVGDDDDFHSEPEDVVPIVGDEVDGKKDD